MKYKLGDRVECNGYLSKIKGIDYIYANKKHFERENKKEGGTLDEPKQYLNDLTDDEYYQKTMEFIPKKFKGVVVARKNIPIENCYTQASEAIYDPITFGYVDERWLDSVRVEKVNYIECYQVFYSLGHSRLVPTSEMKQISGDIDEC